MTEAKRSADPKDLPAGWRPYLREASLIRSCLNSGLNSLSKANHTDPGLYSQAFFNLHAGFERLLKLIFIIDFALTNQAQLPGNNVLKRRFSHNLVALFDSAQDTRARLATDGNELKWELVNEELAKRVVRVLAEFGVASRYYNLDVLAGGASAGRDPINAWATDVALYLDAEYPDRRSRADELYASDLDDLLGDRSSVMHESASGDPIRDIKAWVHEGRREEWIQQSATFHVATMVRYHTEILRVLNRQCGPGSSLELPHLWEFFSPYNNPDKELKGRRTFL
jgi:hypothetical protein